MLRREESNKISKLFLVLLEHFARMKTPYSKDFDYAMVPFKILSWPMGTWPLHAYNFFAFIRFIVAVSILLSMELIVHSEMYLNPNTDAETNLDALLLIVCGSLALSKAISYRVYSVKLVCNFVSALKDYTDLIDEKERMIMRRHAYMGRVAFVCVMLSANICAGVMSAAPLLVNDNKDINATVKDELQFPIPSKHVVLLLKLPDSLYFLVFFVEYAMLMFTLAGNLGSDVLFFAIVFHLCGQVEILKMQFNRLVGDDGKTRENFHSLIERHEYLLKLSRMLNDVISSVLVVQLLASSILICTGGFQFILALSNRNIVMVVKAFTILSTLLIQLFSYSYVGHYLKSQMDGLGFSLYSCSWYNLPVDIAKNIIFVIQKSQIPVCITAGKFFVINLETYMSILKTSMSYLSVLRVMINT